MNFTYIHILVSAFEPYHVTEFSVWFHELSRTLKMKRHGTVILTLLSTFVLTRKIDRAVMCQCRRSFLQRTAKLLVTLTLNVSCHTRLSLIC
jgi:hypothetical protein